MQPDPSHRSRSDRRWRTRGLRVLIVTGFVAVSATACSASRRESDVAKVHGIPVLKSALSPAGTDLGSGFEVPAGTVLVGATVPNEIVVVHRGRPIEDRGWTAWMLMSGDPRHALDSVVRQARAQRIPARRDCWSEGAVNTWCGVRGLRHAAGRTRWIEARAMRTQAVVRPRPVFGTGLGVPRS